MTSPGFRQLSMVISFSQADNAVVQNENFRLGEIILD